MIIGKGSLPRAVPRDTGNNSFQVSSRELHDRLALLLLWGAVFLRTCLMSLMLVIIEPMIQAPILWPSRVSRCERREPLRLRLLEEPPVIPAAQ